MKNRLSRSAVLGLVCAAAVAGGAAFAAQHQMPMGRTPAPAGAKAYIISPKDGETVKNPVKVVMGLSGMGIAPAGMDAPETGHHHLVIDGGDVAVDKPIPSDDKHRHFGKGQTETTITLPPGRHTLQLVLGDKAHVPHNPPVMSDKITINVTE